MSSSNPPKFASWLLHHQVGGYRAESLIGDLTEEYAQGRGTGWFWRQVLLAVTRSHARALRLFGLRFLVAVVAGWGVLLIGITLLAKIGGAAQHLRIPGLLYQAIWIFLAASIDFVVGGLVVRIYRPHQRLMAGVFAVTILLYMLPSIYREASMPLLAQQLIFTVLWMSSAWLGGLWQIRGQQKHK